MTPMGVNAEPFDPVAWAKAMIADGVSFTDDDMVTLTGGKAAAAWRAWGGSKTGSEE